MIFEYPEREKPDLTHIEVYSVLSKFSQLVNLLYKKGYYNINLTSKVEHTSINERLIFHQGHIFVPF